jgi:hypothetical protein
VIGAAGLMYVVEFFADKIPWVDSMWDAIHTFIRPLGAAWLGRRGLRASSHPVDLDALTEVRVRRGVLLDDLFLRSGTRVVRLRFTRDRRRALEALAEQLDARRGTTRTAA